MTEPKLLKCDRCGKEVDDWQENVTRVIIQNSSFVHTAFICPACAVLLKLWLEG